MILKKHLVVKMSENWTNKLKCSFCARIGCSIEICPCKCHKMKLGVIEH
jgi:hypothetical protein